MVTSYNYLFIVNTDDYVTTGPFRLKYFYDGSAVNLKDIEFILEERIVSVQRCCCSLTKWFPSGVFTVFTWSLFGTTVRHEYIILRTTNHIILIEITGDTRIESKQECLTKIDIRRISRGELISETQQKLENDKWYARALKKFECDEDLRFNQIINYLKAWVRINKVAGSGEYNLLQRNCKTLARSLFYFVKNDISTTIDSIFFKWVEKPLYLPHLDIMLCNEVICGVENYFNPDTLSELRRLLEAIREVKMVEEINDLV